MRSPENVKSSEEMSGCFLLGKQMVAIAKGCESPLSCQKWPQGHGSVGCMFDCTHKHACTRAAVILKVMGLELSQLYFQSPRCHC